jgi:2-dehydro-3-deoxy-D-arabinonate dehydratase
VAVIGDDVFDLSEHDESVFGSWVSLLEAARTRQMSLSELVHAGAEDSKTKYSYLGLWEETPQSESHLLLPVEAPEVWACGVTYAQSRTAREDETTVKGIYQKVYGAERPEIFFKGTGRCCVPHHGEIGIRFDSSWSIPEPELAFVLGLEKEIIGVTVGNDVSSRDIERLNPLYLPQAKSYDNSCAYGPAILLGDVNNLGNFEISLKIHRGRKVVFTGSTNTSKMKRGLNELKGYLLRCNNVPPLSICLTGTGIVPPDDFALRAKDVVEIGIDRIGVLSNVVGVVQQ